MTNEFVSYHPDMKIGEVLRRFRDDAVEMESVSYVYVADSDDQLVGTVTLKGLLMADPEAKLSEIMETKLKSVPPETDEMEVVSIISKYGLLALPVVDKNSCMLGIVTIDVVVDRILPTKIRKMRRGV